MPINEKKERKKEAAATSTSTQNGQFSREDATNDFARLSRTTLISVGTNLLGNFSFKLKSDLGCHSE